MNKNEKFELNLENLHKILKYLKTINTNLRFRVDRSESSGSNSFYIKLYLGGSSGLMRISDHENKYTIGDNLRISNYVVSKETKNINVINMLQQRINNIKYKQNIKRMEKLFKEISSGNRI